MEQIRRRWWDLSLRKTLVVYITAAVLLALALCEMTANLCDLGPAYRTHVCHIS